MVYKDRQLLSSIPFWIVAHWFPGGEAEVDPVAHGAGRGRGDRDDPN
jgi:hypothetical protein